MKKPTLSVIIIAKNEAHDIRKCLEAVKWVDEIIVLDSGSTDDTQQICLEYTNKVFPTDWPGYGIQKNRALQHASGDWVLSLDADETLSPELQQEISTAITTTSYSAYNIPFQSLYCGKLIKHGAWRKESHVRLFKRSHGKFTDSVIHENLLIEGAIGQLQAPILHETYKNLEEVLTKLNHYSTCGAEQRLKEGKKGGLLRAILHSWWAFFRSYILQLGFLDGSAGFMLAVSNAHYSYYRYLKLKFLTQNYPSATNNKII